MDRVAVRPYLQITVLLTASAAFVLVGATMFADDVIAERDWFGVGLGVVCVVGGLVAAWRVLRMGVVFDAEGVHIRGVDTRDQFVPWSEITAIGWDETDRRVLPIYSPVLIRGEDVLALPVLGSYRREHAEGRAWQLNALRARSVVPPV